MASSYLGPESHQPLAVISESFQKMYNIPEFGELEKFSFGKQYEERMYMLIHKYLDLETVDKLCYVGDNKGSIAYHLQEKFVLLEPVTTVVPGHFHYAETDGHKMLPIRIAHVGAEEYFRQLVQENKRGEQTIFDKVILKEVVRYFTNPEQLYQNVLKCLSPTGKLLIIHRAGSLTTLPYFKDAKQRFVIFKYIYSCHPSLRVTQVCASYKSARHISLRVTQVCASHKSACHISMRVT